MEIKRIFIIAIIFRLLLSPLFYHRDIKTQNFHLQYFAQGQVNIYKYINEHKAELPYRDTFNYLPLTYIGLGSIQALLNPILPSDFKTWINDWSQTQDDYPNLLYFMLILKLPYILFDLGIGYLLYKLFSKKVLSIWLFNPFSFYYIYILANFDVIPVFFSILAFYYLKQGKQGYPYIYLGIATALKVYPLLFFPFFIFFKKDSLKKIFTNSLIFITPIFISVVPFLGDSSFLQSFAGSGLTQKIIEIKYLNIPIFPILYIIIFARYYLSKTRDFEESITYLFLTFIVFVNFHPQWLLWFLPFSIFLINKSKIRNILLTIILSLCMVYVFLINDQYLFWAHLIPINYDFLLLPHPTEVIIQKFHQDPVVLQGYLKTILALLSLVFVFSSRHEKNT